MTPSCFFQLQNASFSLLSCQVLIDIWPLFPRHHFLVALPFNFLPCSKLSLQSKIEQPRHCAYFCMNPDSWYSFRDRLWILPLPLPSWQCSWFFTTLTFFTPAYPFLFAVVRYVNSVYQVWDQRESFLRWQANWFDLFFALIPSPNIKF